MVPRWIIIYGDRTTYSHLDGPPEKAPPANVQIVKQVMPDGSRVKTDLRAMDYYIWRGDGCGWYGCDMGGLWDYLLIGTGWKYVLSGRSIRNEDYWELVNWASKVEVP